MSIRFSRARLFQTISLLVIQAISLIILAILLRGIVIESFVSALGVAIAYTIAQTAFWLLFIRFLAWIPGFLYPIFTFVLSGIFVAVVGNWVRGVTIDSWVTGLWITIWLTAVNAVFSGLLSLDEDANFDRNVTRQMVKRSGDITRTDVPGFLYLEIDGLGEQLLRQAIQEDRMPVLKKWLDGGTHRITGWETDYSSQTGAMQPGILLGNNVNVPAYRWWDRAEKKIVKSGDPRDAVSVEGILSSGRGLLSDGGASRGNMYSGDALESLLTMSTVLSRSRKRGPSFYFFLFSPYVVARLVTRFISECIKELYQAGQQKRRKDPYRVNARNLLYAPLRGFMSPIMQDLATYMVISDVLRGVPAIYGLYAGYDDLAHFSGMQSREAFESLSEIDRYFARIEKALEFAPRPYHVVVLSDHGQTLGLTFENTYQVSIEGLVGALIAGKGEVYAAQKTHETWDKLSVLLSEATIENTRTAALLKSMLKNKRKGEMVQVGPEYENEKARSKDVVVLASGCASLIYFTQSETRQTYEQIQQQYPDLLVGLVHHEGVGFVMVKSEENGNMAIGKKGIHFLDDGKVEGEDPLLHYGANAELHLKREAGFENCPDILINSAYDPQKQEMCCFEDQVSHHGGLGGPQNYAFLVHPVSLEAGDEPIVTAVGVYRVMRRWRDQVQGYAGTQE